MDGRFAFLALCLFVAPAHADEGSGGVILPGVALPPVGSAKTVYIQARTTTWRSRGRVSFAVVPSLRMKLAAAGLEIAPEETAPHDLVLRVDYRETRDREFRFGLHGTEITCAVRLEDPQGEMLLGLTIHESPPDDPNVTAPYTDVVHKLETNPYFYFLGEIVKGRVETGMDTTGALIAAFARMTERVEPEYGSMKGPPPNPGETLPPSEVLWVREVRANTAGELASLADPRAVPVLTRLLTHPDWQVRRLAVDTLAAMRADDVRTEIERLAAQDEDQRVRAAANAALARLLAL
jgi:hypothetical protein